MDRIAKPARFLTEEEKKRVASAVGEAEGVTSAEIRVVLTDTFRADPLDEAGRWFAKLRMDKTRDRNGVLLLLAVKSRKFAILGDEGIHRFMGHEGWESVRDHMSERFRADDFAGGIERGVAEIGRVLAEHFPRRPDDVNELPNEVVED